MRTFGQTNKWIWLWPECICVGEHILYVTITVTSTVTPTVTPVLYWVSMTRVWDTAHVHVGMKSSLCSTVRTFIRYLVSRVFYTAFLWGLTDIRQAYHSTLCSERKLRLAISCKLAETDEYVRSNVRISLRVSRFLSFALSGSLLLSFSVSFLPFHLFLA